MRKMKNVITRLGEASYTVPSESRGVIFSLEDSFTKQDKRPGKNDVIGRSPIFARCDSDIQNSRSGNYSR